MYASNRNFEPIASTRSRDRAARSGGKGLLMILDEQSGPTDATQPPVQTNPQTARTEKLERARQVPEYLKVNLGTRPLTTVRTPRYPDAGAAVRTLIHHRPTTAVDVLLVNPPSPDGGVWIRTQHRVGRRSREEMIWPQCSLAQHAAMLYSDYSFEIIDAI